MSPYRSFRAVAFLLLPLTALLTLTYVAYQSFDAETFQNSDTQDLHFDHTPPTTTHGNSTTAVKAAFVVLVRNSELTDLRSSMRQMEDRFNHRYNYPWVFLNDADFTDEFKEKTSGLASGQTFYGKVDDSMWGYPEWIDQTKASETRVRMKDVIYGDSESYRHMCRYQNVRAECNPWLLRSYAHLLFTDFRVDFSSATP